MNPRDFEQREELLVDLMAEYDEALAADASTDAFNTTTAELDPRLAAEWAGIKECLELLDRVRRSEEGSEFRVQGSDFSPIAAPHPSPLPKGEGTSRRLGRFLLERELGRGGLGIVYLAHDPQLGRKVALKVPRFQALLDHDLRRRFLREADAAVLLRRWGASGGIVLFGLHGYPRCHYRRRNDAVGWWGGCACIRERRQFAADWPGQTDSAR
jgi:hypothetical protein